MGQQDVSDEVMLHHAGKSAKRLVAHLWQHAAGRQGEGAGPDIATATPVGELESAVRSLRSLVTLLDKESQRR